MQCSLFHTSSGPAFICARGKRTKPCRHCSDPSSLLCDYPVRGGKTCSAPICGACAAHRGENLDYCREHGPFVFLTPYGRRIIVGNIRDLGSKAGVLIDRTTPLGNPARLKSEVKREECFNYYHRWLWSRLCEAPDGPEATELRRLATLSSESNEDLIVLCHCAPLACHGQLVARAIIWEMNGRPMPNRRNND
jgi:hypothetical protein